MTIYTCDGCGIESEKWEDFSAVRWNYNHDVETLSLCAQCKDVLRQTMKDSKNRTKERVVKSGWWRL